MTKFKIKAHLWAACLSVLSLQPIWVNAAPGELAQYPLFTAGGSGSNTPANIFFQVDDSGSMDWDIITPKYWVACLYDPENPGILGGKSCSPTTLQDNGIFNTYSTSTKNSVISYSFSNVKNLGGFTSSTISTNMKYDWRIRSAQMNLIYYNPELTYLPWRNGDGTMMANASFTAAKDYPAATSSTVNLTNFMFEVALDSHGYTGSKPSYTAGGTSTSQKIGTVITTTVTQGFNRVPGANGKVDFWDEHTEYTVGASGITKKTVTYNPIPMSTTTGTASCNGSTPVVSPTNYATVTGCGTNNVTIKLNGTQKLNPQVATETLTTGLYGRTLAEEQTNIANWYQYYRQRINVAKAAIGQVIDENPKYRYGLNTIHNTLFVAIPSANVTDFVPSNVSLLSAFYLKKPGSGTNLPDALNRVGEYFTDGSTVLTDGKNKLGTASPIIYECQQNFAVLMSDGYWNDDLDAGPQALIGNSDGDAIGSTHSTVADVAHYYYSHDLSPVKWDNKVPTNDFDTNNRQHLVTFTVAFGLKGDLLDTNGDGWPDINEVTNSTGPFNESGNWGDPSGGTDKAEKIDDLWHAAFNAKGLYVSAASPDDISAGFAQILDNISKRDYEGSSSAIAFSSATSSSLGSVYVAQFSKPISGSWSGDVLSVSSDPSKKWNAADKVELQKDPDCNTTTLLCQEKRRIFTSVNGVGVPFQWNNLATNQLDDLKAGGADNIKAFARLAYLRGDTRQEKGQTGAVYNFRSRTQKATDGTVHTNLLGDIVHSDPVFVKGPEGSWPNAAPFPIATLDPAGTGSTTSSYDNFKLYLAKYPRTGIVYAGANDGMLHAFDADTGAEKMAYIPNTLFSTENNAGLHYLTDAGYTHRYYVDMPSVVSDVFLNNEWRTYLIGGEMGGGRGIFALDITDPDLFNSETPSNAQQIVKWEFDNNIDPDMGYSYAIPSIVMTKAIKNGKNRWAVIFGNGYNSGGKNSAGGKGTGRAALFAVFLDRTGWIEGVDYVKIVAPSPDNTDPTAAEVAAASAGIDCNNTTLYDCNGLSIPQGYSTLQNKVTDRVYAGDVKGNLWTFDLSNTDPAQWGIAYGGAATPKPLFTAKFGLVRQPITSRPMVVKNEAINLKTDINMLVMFGTGQYLVSGDPATNDQQSVYAVWDHTHASAPTKPLSSANLQQQTFINDTFYSTDVSPGLDVTAKVRVLSDNPVKYTLAGSSKQGWFINLPAPKERLVVDPDIVQDKYFFFNTWVPGETTQVVNGCSEAGSAGGTGYLMNVDVFTGTATSEPIIDFNLDGVVNEKDKVANASNLANATLTAVVGGVLYNQGLPASSSFLNQNQYTAGASYNANADAEAAAAAAAAKIIAEESAAAAAQAALDTAAAQAAYDAALAGGNAAEIAAKLALLEAAKNTQATLDAKAAADLAAYKTLQALANDAAAASSKAIKLKAVIRRMRGGWKQEVRD
jgi:type IV pilus assembly protein PilY1